MKNYLNMTYEEKCEYEAVKRMSDVIKIIDEITAHKDFTISVDNNDKLPYKLCYKGVIVIQHNYLDVISNMLNNYINQINGDSK